MDAEKVLQLLVERSAAINTYWNVFSAVAFGCLGLLASAKPFTSSRVFKFVISIGFIWFACSNLDAILSLNKLRNALADLVRDDYLQATIRELRPDSPLRYILFHVGLDLAVISCIWCVRWPDGGSVKPVS